MLRKRIRRERGSAKTMGFESFYTFSFGDFHDREHMNFRALRALNDHRVKGAHFFDNVTHRNMEIVLLVLSGRMSHESSLGGKKSLETFQAVGLSTGSGVTHRESNLSKSEELRFLELWFYPKKRGAEPKSQVAFFEIDEEAASKDGVFTLLGSGAKSEEALTIGQDVGLYLGVYPEEGSVCYEFLDGSCGWVQILDGEFQLGDMVLRAGDGVAITAEPSVQLTARKAGRFLLFDMADREEELM